MNCPGGIEEISRWPAQRRHRMAAPNSIQPRQGWRHVGVYPDSGAPSGAHGFCVIIFRGRHPRVRICPRLRSGNPPGSPFSGLKSWQERPHNRENEDDIKRGA